MEKIVTHLNRLSDGQIDNQDWKIIHMDFVVRQTKNCHEISDKY